MLDGVIVFLTIVGALIGFVAAWCWHKSASVEAPDFGRINSLMAGEDGQTPVGVWAAEIAGHNKTAARLTAFAVAIAAVTSLLGLVH